MTTAPAFQEMASETATVKRPPDIANGKRGTPVLVDGVSYACFPVMPMDAQTRETMALDSPHRLLMTYIEGDSINVTEGDILVIDSVEYPIKKISRYPYDTWYYYEIILEEHDV